MKLSWILFYSLVFSMILSACGTEYDRKVKSELAKGERYDSLFLDIQFGMSRKDFFAHCWELNKQGVLRQGPSNLSVEHVLELPSGQEAFMCFYPRFHEDKIYVMPMELSYTQWMINREETTSDNLVKDMVALMEKWHGPGFFEVTNKEGNVRAMVKVDGNRRIRIWKKSISTIRAEYMDLITNEFIKDEKSN